MASVTDKSAENEAKITSVCIWAVQVLVMIYKQPIPGHKNNKSTMLLLLLLRG